MKHLSIILFALCVLAPSVHAETLAARHYRRYHAFVYWPTHVIAFILAGPVIIATSVVQRHDDTLRAAAENER